MATIPIDLPLIQNWSCHSCGGCCRQHLVEITDDERRRIEAQNWTDADGIPADRPVIVRHGHQGATRTYRLNHAEDGGCVFLDSNGLCRIHAKFGEPAKPLACRLYPYAFHPGGQRLALGLRFSCPSVVRNAGARVVEQRPELERLAREAVPEDWRKTPPPAVSPQERIDWPDLLKIVATLERTMSSPLAPLDLRIQRSILWIGLIEQSKFSEIGTAQLGEFLQLIVRASEIEFPEPHEVPQPGESPQPLEAGPENASQSSSTPAAPSALARQQFRMLVAQYLRRDTFASRRRISDRLRLLTSAARFALGKGRTPKLHPDFPAIPFSALEKPLGQLPPEGEELLTRYLQVKIVGMHFCGPAYYDVPLCEGWFSLILATTVIRYLARWQALTAGRSSLIVDDVAKAVSTVDHHHGYSPPFGQWSFRRRVRLLASLGEISRLSNWYAQ